MFAPVRTARMHAGGSWRVSASEPSKGRGAAARSSISISISGSGFARVCASECVRACVCEGCRGERRGEADAAGLPGEEAGAGEQTQPLSSTAGQPGAKDAVAQSGAAGTGGETWVVVVVVVGALSMPGGGLLLEP